MPEEKIQGRSGFPENTERSHRLGLCLTDELELRFLENLREHGRTKDTISVYRRNLSRLRKSLPEDSKLDPAFLSNWQSELLEQGYSPGTVNSCTATVNSLLEFAGRQDLRVEQVSPDENIPLPELTRNEYLRLLQTAKLLGKRQTYLLVLMFGTMDLPLHALARVTVEAVREGWVLVPSRLRVPPCLRAELLAYAGEQGIGSGPIFCTRYGRPMDRGNINVRLQSLSRDARVSPEKCNPRCLRKLCVATQAGIRSSLELLIEQAYDRLLETEALTVGWNESEVMER
ncbi:tyrosine-type recombinase/integrase [Agathobaculum massiliense]|uniref:tyrosine-type recombinase/integrase n=1 Tax=Agathobaculum massiliense TaxID=3014267 RepID=UPI00131EA5EF|nr:site-specific integrase [Agathobaculum massiliense]